MKRLKFTFFIISLTVFFAACRNGGNNGNGKNISPVKVVVLGSSTAAGTGPKSIDSAWVVVLRRFLVGKNEKNTVINLAKGGYTTYQILPNTFSQRKSRPSPDTQRNISKALTYKPDIIIINLPSNDTANGFSVKEQMNNFEKIATICRRNGVELFSTTAQPRNFDANKRKELMDLNRALREKYTTHVIDFWTDIATNDGKIKPQWGSGDGVHLNGKGHRILAERAIKALMTSVKILYNANEHG